MRDTKNVFHLKSLSFGKKDFIQVRKKRVLLSAVVCLFIAVLCLSILSGRKTGETRHSEVELISTYARLSFYWSRIDPDGKGVKGQTVYTPIVATINGSPIRGSIAVNKALDVAAGQTVELYTDFTTLVQAKSDGYFDLWGLRKSPKCESEAKIKLAEGKLQMSYFLYER